MPNFNSILYIFMKIDLLNYLEKLHYTYTDV